LSQRFNTLRFQDARASIILKSLAFWYLSL
jgi:hypothetical protein